MIAVEGSVTGRWAHRTVGKHAALASAYGGSLSSYQKQSRRLAQYVDAYDQLEARILRWQDGNGGKRHTMKRAHDRNVNAKMRHAQAVLLGWRIRAQVIGEIVVKNDAGKLSKQAVLRWWAHHDARAPREFGPYRTRHRAVVEALKDMGLEA